ncbi:RapZ C-terminal domain-containing protein [Streptomyces sp. UC1A3]
MSKTTPGAVRIVSFGYGHGDAPAAHLTLDLRHHFRDPHISPAMRELTAVHRKVRRTVLGTAGIKALLAATVRTVQAYDAGPSARDTVVAVGCVGGRHRSAVAADVLARRLRRRGHEVTVEHRDLHRPVISRRSR